MTKATSARPSMRPSTHFEQRDIAAGFDRRRPEDDLPQTVTNAERLRILRELAERKPQPQQHLTPNGPMRVQVDQDHDKYKKRRLAHIETRLMVANYGFNRNQQKAFNKDRAKVGFEKASKSQTPKTHESNQERLEKLRAQRSGQACADFNHKAATKSPERTR